jgi:AcrR family transcriptional regulator
MASPAPQNGNRRSRPREIDPRALTAAALELFLENGFANTRMEDIARRAGVSKGALYLYFATKDELFRAVVQEGIVGLIEQAEAAFAASTGSASELLASLMRGIVPQFWDSPSSGIPKLVIAEAQNFPALTAEYFEAISLRTRKLMENILQRGVDRGEFRPLDVHCTARAILAALDHQAILQHSVAAHDPEPLEPQRYVDAVLDLVSHGALAGRAS